MILQIGGIDPRSPIGGILSTIKGFINPQGVRRDAFKQRLAEDPAFALEAAIATRDQLEISSGLDSATGQPTDTVQAFQSGEGPFRPQTPGEQADTTAAFSQTRRTGGGKGGGQTTTDSQRLPARPLAALLASYGFDPDDQEAANLLIANTLRNPSSITEDVTRIDRRTGEARNVAEAGREVITATTAKAKADAATQGNRLRTQKTFGALRGPELEAVVGLSSLSAQDAINHLTRFNAITDQQFRAESSASYVQLLDRLSPEQRQIAALAIENPEFLRHLDRLALMELRERLAFITSRGTPATFSETLAELTSLTSDRLDLVERLAELEQDPKKNKAAIQEAKALLNGYNVGIGMLTQGNPDLEAVYTSTLFEIKGVDDRIFFVPTFDNESPFRPGQTPSNTEQARQFAREGDDLNILVATLIERALEIEAVDPGRGVNTAFVEFIRSNVPSLAILNRFVKDDQFLRTKILDFMHEAIDAQTPAASTGGAFRKGGVKPTIGLKEALSRGGRRSK